MEDDQAEAGSVNTGNEGGAAGSVVRPLGRSGSTLGRDVQTRIGQHLRAMYDDVVRQGVPDRFMTLLARLDEREEDGGEVRDKGMGG